MSREKHGNRIEDVGQILTGRIRDKDAAISTLSAYVRYLETTLADREAKIARLKETLDAKEVWDGRTRESQLTAEQIELAQNAWTHGQEAGYHAGHLDGYRLALAEVTRSRQ